MLCFSPFPSFLCTCFPHVFRLCLASSQLHSTLSLSQWYHNNYCSQQWPYLSHVLPSTLTSSHPLMFITLLFLTPFFDMFWSVSYTHSHSLWLLLAYADGNAEISAYHGQILRRSYFIVFYIDSPATLCLVASQFASKGWNLALSLRVCHTNHWIDRPMCQCPVWPCLSVKTIQSLLWFKLAITNMLRHSQNKSTKITWLGLGKDHSFVYNKYFLTVATGLTQETQTSLSYK